MLPRMSIAETELPEAQPPGPAHDAAAEPQAVVDDSAPRGCPFLTAESGGWRLDAPSRDHRCGAVSPPAVLSPEKQSRLCLTAGYPSCATYLASMSARGARLGAPLSDRATRWQLARTTTVIEEAGGVRSRVSGFVLDRRRWPAIPAVLLVGTLVVLAASGFRAGGTATSPSPSPRPTAAATIRPTPVATRAPTLAPTLVPTVAPTLKPTPKPTPQVVYRVYTVKSGDTLGAIAERYGTTPGAIAKLNGISVGSTLHIGQQLKIPN